MTWTFRCEIADGSYDPGEIPAVDSADWSNTPLGDRLLSFDYARGKPGDLEKFNPGSATIVLDNSDDEMDPLVSGSIMAGLWTQWVPVRVVADNGGDPVPLWTGFVQEVRPTGTNQFPGSVTLTCLDWMGWASQIDSPSAWVGSIRARSTPVLWRRSQSDVVNRAEGDTGGTVFDVVDPDLDAAMNGTARVLEVEGLIPADDAKALRVYGDASHYASFESPASPELPSVTSWTVMCWFKSPNVDQVLVQSEIAGSLAWRIGVDGSGNVYGAVYDSGEAEVARATAISIDTSDNRAYGVEVKFKTDVTRSIDVVVAAAADEFDLDITSGFGGGAVGGGGRVRQGSEAMSKTTRHGDLVIVSSIVSTSSIFYGFDTGYWWLDNTDTLATRTASIGDIHAGTIPANYTWFGADEDIDNPIPIIESTFAGAVSSIAESSGGVIWCQRDGWVRIRDFGSLTDVTYATEYATPIAQVSDEVGISAPPDIIRPGGRGRSGAREDKIVNEMTFLHANGESGAREVDRDSITQYGHRPKEVTVGVTVLTQLPDAAADVIRLFAEPPIGVNDITIQPFACDLIDWYIEDLDLEKMVTYTETTPGGVKVFDEVNMRIARESASWAKGRDLQVTFGLTPA